MTERPPFPPFTEETARQKVLAAEAAWNTRDPDRVVLAYTEDTQWRNRDEFLFGRDEVHAFLVRKWQRELDYVLRKDLWTFAGDRIAVRFQYEWHDAEGRWWRSYGNENWEFDERGLTLAEARVMHEETERMGEALGIRFDFARARRGNTFDAHRLLHMARAQGREDELVARLMAAYFAEGVPIGERAALAGVAAAA